MDPEIELADIPDYSKERIENIEELIKSIQKRNSDRQRQYGSILPPDASLDPYTTQTLNVDGFKTDDLVTPYH